MTVEAAARTVSSLYTTGTSTTTPKKTVDQEMFLALLVAQLRNQDPSSPMDTNEMMAQSTQLASMEQLTALADTGRESFALQMRVAASGLVGQEVSFLDTDGVAHTGTVSGVDFTSAVPAIYVGEWTVPLDAVSAVRTASTSTPAA
jgi:flagellar basal-body rod modification protein FlgD